MTFKMLARTFPMDPGMFLSCTLMPAGGETHANF